MSTPTVRALTCPNCGGTIALRAAGSSVSLVCEHCGTILDATTPELREIGRATEAMHRPEIALGTRGDLFGTTWEAIGYMERSDGDVGWAEYLLFNPYVGYAFLVDDGRRFSLGTLLDRLPEHSWAGMMDRGQTLARFGDEYEVWVRFVVGEFYWRVAIGEAVKETDYVRPGTMLVCEENAAERTWTRLTMLYWGVAEGAFGLPARTREYSQPAPHEPSPWRRKLVEAAIFASAALIALLIATIFSGGTHQLAAERVEVALDSAIVTHVIGPLELPAARSAVTLSASAGQLDNSWIDIDYSLVNRATQESFQAYGVAERYSGTDSDGAWSEGDRSPTVKLSAIPRGSYDLVVELAAHRWQPRSFTFDASGSAEPAIPVDIVVWRGGLFGSNFLVALLLIVAWPLYVLARHAAFEARRKASLGSDDEEDEDEE